MHLTGVYQSATYLGTLHFRLGSRQLSERYNDRNTPVPARALCYLVAGPEIQLVMERPTLLAMKEVNQRDFAKMELPLSVTSATIDEMMLPPGGQAGTLFVRSGDLPDELKTIIKVAGEKFVSDFGDFVRRICLLPGGRWERSELPGFERSMTGASNSAVKEFYAGIKSEESRRELENDCPSTMFFNPYAYDGFIVHRTRINEEERFRAHCFWVSGLSHLLGRMIADSYLVDLGKESFTGKNNLRTYFALVYQADKTKMLFRNYADAFGLVANSLLSEYRDRKKEITGQLSRIALTAPQAEFIRMLRDQFGL